MQSVFKAPLALTVLTSSNAENCRSISRSVSARPIAFPEPTAPCRDQYPAGEVDVPLRQLLSMAVSLSDNVAADILLRLIGGPEVVDRYIKSAGITGFHLKDNEATLHRDSAAQYRNWFEPSGAVEFLRLLSDHPPLTTEHAGLLLGWMRDTPRANQRIKGRLPEGTIVMHKAGTSDTDHGLTAATNDIGLITLPDGRGLLAIAIFVTDSSAGEVERDSVIARIARAASDTAIVK